MKYLILIFVVALAACDDMPKTLSMDQVIAINKKCIEANMRTKVVANERGNVNGAYCEPKDFP